MVTTDSRPPDSRSARRPGDGWVECRCGQRHWGRYGAAGLLLWKADAPSPTGPEGTGVRLVLQHRAHWSHFGGTWGLPGGAVDPDETAIEGALREAAEEAGIDSAGLEVRATYLLDHGDWSYTTVVAEATAPIEPKVCDPESLEVAWAPADSVEERELLPAFADAWPELREIAGRRLTLVVDAANTVGSRPDGWWRDRAGATERLRAELAVLARTGLPASSLDLPGHTWFPQIVLVTEGAARGITTEPGVTVVPAAGSGDDEILAQAGLAAVNEDDVVVVTSDRELRRRVSTVGARTAGPSLVLRRAAR